MHCLRLGDSVWQCATGSYTWLDIKHSISLFMLVESRDMQMILIINTWDTGLEESKEDQMNPSWFLSQWSKWRVELHSPYVLKVDILFYSTPSRLSREFKDVL